MDGRIYVVSDIHGNFDLFERLIKKIEFKDEDHLYILGDICDRGKESLKTYLFIQDFPNITLIKGNHEYMMQEVLKEAVIHNDFDYPSNAYKLWKQNGGEATMDNIREYLCKQGLDYLDYTIVRSAFLKNLYNYFKKLPLYQEITVNNQDYVLVHAGVDPESPLEDQQEDTFLWIRDYFYLSPCQKDKIYIFGHTPVTFINRDKSCHIWYDDQFHNKIGIDGCLAVGRQFGQLNCLCLNDMKEYAIKADE